MRNWILPFFVCVICGKRLKKRHFWNESECMALIFLCELYLCLVKPSAVSVLMAQYTYNKSDGPERTMQECMFLETSQCFCLTSPGEVGCWRAESLEEHPYNKGWMKVSASSQKSWDSMWTKKFMFHGENIIWWEKRLPEKSRHITDHLCMKCSKIVYCCWHCSQRWWSQPVMLGVVAAIKEMTQGVLTLCKSVYTKSNISNLL